MNMNRDTWGWIVCASYLIMCTISLAILFSFSEIVVELNEHKDSSLAQLSIVGALPIGLSNVLAPVGLFLYEKIKARASSFLGTFMMVVALFITAYTNSFALQIVFYGILLGLGRSLVGIVPYFLLERYFPVKHPRHVLATSLNMSHIPAGNKLNIHNLYMYTINIT